MVTYSISQIIDPNGVLGDNTTGDISAQDMRDVIWSVYNESIQTSGDIDGVDAGDGLSGGGTSGYVTLDVNVSNGLSIDSDVVELGGEITKQTQIWGGNQNFIFGRGPTNSIADVISRFQVQTDQIISFDVLSPINGDELTEIRMDTSSSGFEVLVNEPVGGFDGGLRDINISQRNSTGNISNINLRGNGQPVTINSVDHYMIITDDFGLKGLVYNTDYSVNFTEESLITKRYVDEQISNVPTGDITGVTAGDGLSAGGTSGSLVLDVNTNNGISLISDSVGLGGTLIQNTTINLSTNDFILTGSGMVSVPDLEIQAGKVIKSGNGGGQLDLDAYGTANNVFLSTDNSGYNKSGLYLSPSYTELFNYEAGSQMFLYSDDILVLQAANSGLIQIGDDIELIINQAPNIYIDDNSVSDVSTPDPTHTLKGALFLNSFNSTFNAGVNNSVALGGTGLKVEESNTVYVPYFNVKDVDVDNSVDDLVIVDSFGNIKKRSISSLNIPSDVDVFSNVIYVDRIHGNNTDAIANLYNKKYAFLDINTAVTNSSDGDLIYVLPGYYLSSVELVSNRFYYFSPGSRLRSLYYNDGVNTLNNCYVWGKLDILYTSNPAINITGIAVENVYIEVNNIKAVPNNTTFSGGIQIVNTSIVDKLDIKFNNITNNTSNNPNGIFIEGTDYGKLNITGNDIIAGGYGISNRSNFELNLNVNYITSDANAAIQIKQNTSNIVIINANKIESSNFGISKGILFIENGVGTGTTYLNCPNMVHTHATPNTSSAISTLTSQHNLIINGNLTSNIRGITLQGNFPSTVFKFTGSITASKPLTFNGSRTAILENVVLQQNGVENISVLDIANSVDELQIEVINTVIKKIHDGTHTGSVPIVSLDGTNNEYYFKGCEIIYEDYTNTLGVNCIEAADINNYDVYAKDVISNIQIDPNINDISVVGGITVDNNIKSFK